MIHLPRIKIGSERLATRLLRQEIEHLQEQARAQLQRELARVDTASALRDVVQRALQEKPR
jgi:hypothetical protein